MGMLIAEGLSKRYGRVDALIEVSFRLEKGSVTGLLGKNGAGKSTLMNIITGYIAPTRGNVVYNDISLSEQPEAFKRHIGYLPEVPPLYMDMTVVEQLTFAARLKGISKRRIRCAIDEALSMANAQSHCKRLIRSLSKGYRQRVGLAQAMLGLPDVLILDEPGAGLDPEQLAQTRRAVRAYAKEHIALVSSHILSEIGGMCDRVIMLNNGIIAVNDNVSSLICGAISHIWLRYRGEKALIDDIAALDCVESVSVMPCLEEGCTELEIVSANGLDARSAVSACVINANAELLMLCPASNALEDVFLKHIKGGAGK